MVSVACIRRPSRLCESSTCLCVVGGRESTGDYAGADGRAAGRESGGGGHLVNDPNHLFAGGRESAGRTCIIFSRCLFVHFV